MNINIDNLKKRILYRSQYRGSREMDNLLNSFVLKYINEIEHLRYKDEFRFKKKASTTSCRVEQDSIY